MDHVGGGRLPPWDSWALTALSQQQIPELLPLPALWEPNSIKPRLPAAMELAAGNHRLPRVLPPTAELAELPLANAASCLQPTDHQLPTPVAALRGFWECVAMSSDD